MKYKREKIIGTIIPTDLLNLTTEQALDRLAKKHYGGFFRRLRSRWRRWSIEPRQMVGTISSWAFKKLFPTALKPASRPAFTCIVPEIVEKPINHSAADAGVARTYEQELEDFNKDWVEAAPLKSHIPVTVTVPSQRKKVLRKPSKRKSKSKKK